jgi:hypothetical protein
MTVKMVILKIIMFLKEFQVVVVSFIVTAMDIIIPKSMEEVFLKKHIPTLIISRTIFGTLI